VGLETLHEIQGRIAQIQQFAPPSARRTAPQRFDDAFARALRTVDKSWQPVASTATASENGRLADHELELIGIDGHRLAPAAAAAFRRMRADAARAGIEIGVTGAYRDYDAQVDLANRKGLYSNGGLAARPGTSQHGWGLAVDIDVNAAGQAWLRANAARYGFFEDVPREPWHWEFLRGRS
jgi:LAS superfamily LD-carboxypeptidase LdcB